MTELLAVVISGLVSGATYALIALGIVIIFRSTDTVNFAIGDIGTLAVFIAFAAMHQGLPPVAGLIMAFLVAGALGVLVERVLVRPLGRGPQVLFVALVVTIGVGLVIHAGIHTVFGSQPRNFPPVIEGSWQVLGLSMTWNRVAAAAVAAVLMVGVAWFFRATPLGISMRAAAEDDFAARMIGIGTSRVAMIAWFAGCGLAAVACFFLASDTSLNASLALTPLFRAFAGVFLGGITSMPGAAIGGFAIGILDNVAGRYISASFRDTIVFATIVLILFVRPAGFLGAIRKERV